jgi:hypothetical protein
LFDEYVIVTVEDNAHTMIDQQLVNRFSPTGSILIEFVFASRAFSTPFPAWSRFLAASLVAIAAANQVMQEYKSKLCIACCQRTPKPLILLLAQRPIPVAVRTAAM